MNPISETHQLSPANTTLQFVRDTVVDWMRQAGMLVEGEIEDSQPLYELGIDSLGTVEIAAALERGANKKMNPEMIYELETVCEIANYLDSLPLARSVGTTVSPLLNEKEEPGSDAPTTTAGRAGFSRQSPLLNRYQILNRRVDSLAQENRYFFEPVISEHDGAWVVVDGQRMLMLASYEYLGLLNNDHLKRAAIDSVRHFGTGHHGSRILTGTTTAHRQLEQKLASYMHTEEAIVFSSGYVTNLAVISALVGPGDCVIGDQFNHASINDGCRLSGANR